MRTETARILKTIGVHEHLPSLSDLCAARPPSIDMAFCTSVQCAGAYAGGKPRRKLNAGKHDRYCRDCGSALKWKTVKQKEGAR